MDNVKQDAFMLFDMHQSAFPLYEAFETSLSRARTVPRTRIYGGMHMWTCPRCGREFKRTNQGHYCGKAPENVNEYIELQIPEARNHLSEIRNIILSSVPDIKERIAWSMPIYENEKGSVSFAACKNHVSLYVDIGVLDSFKLQLSEYSIKKNAVYFPYSKALPGNLIKNIIRQCFITK